MPAGVEFHMLPYDDIPDFGFDRGREFCMLALRHPLWETRDEAQRKELYEQKRADRQRRVNFVFEKCDPSRSGALDEAQLCEAMRLIGMPAHSSVAHGLIYRHGQDGHIGPQEFANVVTEIWGRVPNAAYSDRLERLHDSLDGTHAVSFVGRQSPAAWVLRLVRNAWPFALKRVAIMQNLTDNPNLEMKLATMLIDTYEGQSAKGLNTAMDLAEVAHQHSPTAKGGIFVRMVPTNSERWPEGGVHTVVPFRGLPENRPATLGGHMKRLFWR